MDTSRILIEHERLVIRRVKMLKYPGAPATSLFRHEPQQSVCCRLSRVNGPKITYFNRSSRPESVIPWKHDDSGGIQLSGR